MKIPIILLLLFSILIACVAKEKNVEDQVKNIGLEIFMEKCSPCHFNGDKDLTAPSLFGVTKRLPLSKLIRWIRNSNELLVERDPYFLDLYAKWAYTIQPPFPELSDDNIIAVLRYIESWDELK